MLVVKGVLANPFGNPIAEAVIRFTAIVAEGSVLKGVDLGGGSIIKKKLRSSRLVQHDVALGLVVPLHTLHAKTQPHWLQLQHRIAHRHKRLLLAIPNLNPTLLYQARAHPANTKALRIQNILKLHHQITQRPPKLLNHSFQ